MATRKSEHESFLASTASLYEAHNRRIREEGRAEGVSIGLAPLVRVCARRIARALTDEERETLSARLFTHSADSLGDVVLDLDPDALARWLHDPDAR